MTDKKWRQIKKLIMRWAQDDGNADELAEIIGSSDEDKFWEEFEARLTKSFG